MYICMHVSTYISMYLHRSTHTNTDTNIDTNTHTHTNTSVTFAKVTMLMYNVKTCDYFKKLKPTIKQNNLHYIYTLTNIMNTTIL